MNEEFDSADLAALLATSPGDRVTIPDGWSLRASLRTNPIDWERLAPLLDEPSRLPLAVRARIRAVSDNPQVVEAASNAARDLLQFAIGIIAWIDRDRSPVAEAMAQRQMGGIPSEKVAALVEAIEARS